MSFSENGKFKTIQLAVGGFDSNFSYLILSDTGTAALADPCGDAEIIRRAFSETGAEPQYILITHAHPDHISALEEVRQTFFSAPVCASEKGPLNPEIPLKDAQELPFGTGFIRCFSLPGHSDDSMAFQLSDNSAVFTGDTLFIDCIGFCHPKRMYRSLAKLRSLPPELTVYSGHDYGHVPAVTLEEQLRDNPYLREQSYEEFFQLWKKLE